MGNLELNDLVTAVIAVINIITTVILTLVNLYFLRQTQKQTLKREAIARQYKPILDLLLKLQMELKKSLAIDSKFDILNPSMESKESRDRRIMIINSYYKKYVEHENNMEYQYCNKKLDASLFAVKEHMLFVISTIGADNLMNTSENHSKYPTPDYEKIIQKIAEYLKLKSFIKRIFSRAS